MGVRFTGDWNKALTLSKRAKAAVAKVLKKEADDFADLLRKGLASGSPAGTGLAPLHPLTAALKGSNVPLAGMERWVVVASLGPMRFFIGFRDPEGIRYGTIHEEGRSWTMVWTAKQRAWFFATMARLGLLDESYVRNPSSIPGEVHYEIPARPWLQPVVDKYLPAAQERIAKAVAAEVWK